MNREQGLALIEQTRIIAIIRGVEETHMDRLADALYDGGIKAMEVTLNTPGALDIIPRLQDRVGERMYIGAGTVIDLDDAKKAIAAGAAYLVTPNTDEDVIRYGVEQGVPVFPGAMTPSEIVKAWKTGATAVKIFPGASLDRLFERAPGTAEPHPDGSCRGSQRGKYQAVPRCRMLRLWDWRLARQPEGNSQRQLQLGHRQSEAVNRTNGIIKAPLANRRREFFNHGDTGHPASPSSCDYRLYSGILLDMVQHGQNEGDRFRAGCALIRCKEVRGSSADHPKLERRSHVRLRPLRNLIGILKGQLRIRI